MILVNRKWLVFLIDYVEKVMFGYCIRVILAVGLGMLVIGTKANSKSNASCGLSHHRFLSIGGILCFVHSLFSIAYYVTATASIHWKVKKDRNCFLTFNPKIIHLLLSSVHGSLSYSCECCLIYTFLASFESIGNFSLWRRKR